MKIRLAVILVLMVIVSGAIVPVYAQRKPNRLAVETRALISKAAEMSEYDPLTAGTIFRQAFENAVALTQPKMGSFWQEVGLALASRCLSPDLFPEVRIAAETYREKFPTGPRMREVLISLALLEAAEGNERKALALLNDAASRTEGSKRVNIEALALDTALSARFYRTAEKMLAELNAGRTIRRFKRDQKRFQEGTALLNAVLKEVVEGRVSGETAVRTLRNALEVGYFAEEAPAAELRALREEDSMAPMVHRREVRFFGTRVVTHAMSPQSRVRRLEAFVNSYPEADPQLKGKALHQLYLICLHELRDEASAEAWLRKLEAVPGFASKAQIEKLLRQMTDRPLHDKGMLELLISLEQALGKEPYDNGYVPVLEPQRLKLLVAQANLFQGQYRAVLSFIKQMPENLRVRSVPMRLLYALLADDKVTAHQMFVQYENGMIPGDRKMVKDFLYPLYLPTRENEKRILVATALAVDHTETAIDVLFEATKQPKRSCHFDHALALLAELYQRQGSYAEAQSVWVTLRRIFPDSVWTR